MTHLEIAQKACEHCGACRAGIPIILCPRSPYGFWENVKYYLGFTKSFWGLAHFDFFHTYEAAGIFICYSLEIIEPLITGYTGAQNHVPVFEDGFEDVWDSLVDELDDEGDDDNNTDKVPDN